MIGNFSCKINEIYMIPHWSEGRDICERKGTKKRKSASKIKNAPHKQGKETFFDKNKSFLCIAFFHCPDYFNGAWHYNPQHLEQYSFYNRKLYEGFNGFLWANSEPEPHCLSHEHEWRTFRRHFW